MVGTWWYWHRSLTDSLTDRLWKIGLLSSVEAGVELSQSKGPSREDYLDHKWHCRWYCWKWYWYWRIFCRIPPIQYFSAPPAAVRAVQGTRKLWKQWRLVPKRGGEDIRFSSSVIIGQNSPPYYRDPHLEYLKWNTPLSFCASMHFWLPDAKTDETI